MADDVLIRPVSPADLPAITRIYRQAVLEGTASFELEAPDEAEMTRRYETLMSGGYPYLVAEIGERRRRLRLRRDFIARGRPIAGRSRIRSTSTPRRTAAGLAARCSAA